MFRISQPDCATRIPYSDRRKWRGNKRSSYRSSHCGLSVSISASFFARLNRFSSFSRPIAVSMSPCCSNHTSSLHVLFGKAVESAFAVFESSLKQIAGDANVQRAVAFARHDVRCDKLVLHRHTLRHPGLAKRDRDPGDRRAACWPLDPGRAPHVQDDGVQSFAQMLSP